MRWVGLGVVVLIGIVIVVAKKSAEHAGTDLGSVSDQWLAQHRREP
jgi:hypothetical protein